MSGPIVDTNIIIDWLRERPEGLAELSSHDAVRISRVTWTEVLAGEPIAGRAHVQHLMRRFVVVELDARIATVAADVRHLRRIKLIDAFIYATARVVGTLLVTRNTRDFPADMPGIRVPYIL